MTASIWSVRVYYEDTDSGGVVYYANYLKFLERARTEWLRELGFEQDDLIEREGVIFAVRSVAVDYRQPARFNDVLEVRTSLLKVGRASIDFSQRVFREESLLVDGVVKIASLDADGFRPKGMPNRLLESARAAMILAECSDK